MPFDGAICRDWILQAFFAGAGHAGVFALFGSTLAAGLGTCASRLRRIRVGLTVGNTPEACADCVQLCFDFGAK